MNEFECDHLDIWLTHIDRNNRIEGSYIHTLEYLTLEHDRYEWLSRTRYHNTKELGEKICTFIRALRLPPPPPRKPMWDAKSCIMSWTLLKLRRRGDALDEDLVHSLHFFLVPQVDNIQIQSVAEDELDAAIDEGRPSRSMKYLVSRGLVGSVAIYGAALLVSAPVVLTATALYGAKKACVVSLKSLVSHSLILPHSQGNDSDTHSNTGTIGDLWKRKRRRSKKLCLSNRLLPFDRVQNWKYNWPIVCSIFMTRRRNGLFFLRERTFYVFTFSIHLFTLTPTDTRFVHPHWVM